MPKKPAPDLIWGVQRLSDNIMRRLKGVGGKLRSSNRSDHPEFRVGSLQCKPRATYTPLLNGSIKTAHKPL
jgi:hypothetical protein